MFKQINNKHIIAISFIIIFLSGIIIGVGIYNFISAENIKGMHVYKNKGDNAKKSKEEFAQSQSLLDAWSNSEEKNLKTKNEPPVNPTIFPKKVLFETNDYQIKKGDIEWSAPVVLNNIGLTNEEVYQGCGILENQKIKQVCLEKGLPTPVIKYIKVGQVNSGKYKGSDLIVIFGRLDIGMGGLSADGIRFLKNNKKIIFLTKNLERYDKSTIKKYFLEGDFDFVIDEGTEIIELNTPEKINFTRGILIKNKYDKAFFVKDKLKPIEKIYLGQLWMTDHKKSNSYPSKYELNAYSKYDSKNKKFIKEYKDIFGKDAFYLKLPDGTAVSYKMQFDIFDENNVLKATWNDGSINQDVYQIRPSGCGGGGYYVYNVTGKIDINTQLVQVGHTITGDPLYGYKDDTSELFQDFYNNIYKVQSGKQKEGLQYVLDNHLQVFWVDPFGRLLTFYKEEALGGQRAECGKPVIYLYPEKPTTVKVRVEPNQGLSISEPKYSDEGWNVFAKPNGDLFVDNKKYPYLFWEGSSDVTYEQSERGWVVSKNNLNKFLDDKLHELGLIQKEIEDFKEFWIPEMTKNNKNYYFITFLPQRKIDQLAPLTISPSPDTIIRVMMDYRELDQPENSIGFKIKTPVRKGFTVVEWGGMLK